MKRRTFLRGLLACAAIAFARPAILEAAPVAAINPAWEEATHEVYFVGTDGIRCLSPGTMVWRTLPHLSNEMTDLEPKYDPEILTYGSEQSRTG